MNEDNYFDQRGKALSDALALSWNKIEDSILWNKYEELSANEIAQEKVRIQHSHFHPTITAFKMAFMPTVLDIKSDDIRLVLQYGAGRRLKSIYAAAISFANIAYPSRTDVTTEDEAVRLGDALMIIYINIPAFFDALSVASYRSVLPKKYQEKEADLFSRKYLLAIGLEELYPEIAEYFGWMKRVKIELRHRFAHRIPPYVPSAQHSPEDSKLFKKLQNEYSTALKERRFDALAEIVDRQKAVGSFAPWIYFFEEDAQMPLQSTVLNDLLTFQVVALTIFERLIGLPGFFDGEVP